MKFKIQIETLYRALEMIKGVVDRRQTILILSHILLKVEGNSLTLTGTDHEMTIQKQIAVESEKEGSATVSARKLMDMCHRLPKESWLSVEQESNRIIFKADTSRFHLMSLPIADFPNIGVESSHSNIQIPEKMLCSLIESTYFSIPQQDVRYYLNGMLWDIQKGSFYTVSTDGHRLAKDKLNFNSSQTLKIIIPRKVIFELFRILDKNSELPIELNLTPNQLYIKSHDYKLTSRLIDGKFPEYEKFIPKSENEIAYIDRDCFKNALSRMEVLLNDKYPGVRLSLSDNTLVLQARNLEKEEAEERLTIDYQPKVLNSIFNIAFNIRYLVEVINALPRGQIKLSYSSPDKSVLIQHSAQEHPLYVIMPMRL